METGKIVAFFEQKKILCAVCLEVKGGRVHLLTEENREMTRRTELGNWGLPVHPSPSIPRIISSDSHFLEDIGSAYTVYLLAEPSLAELRLALRGQEGRRIVERVDRGVIVL